MVQAGSQCYPTAEAAALVQGSALVGQPLGSALVQSVHWNSGAVVYQLSDGRAQTQVSVPVSFPPCQLYTASDGAALAGLVLLCWVAAFAFRVLGRLFWEGSNSDDT